jgi:MFS family permease
MTLTLATVALFPFSFYVLALGFGPILAAPVSETFGRQVIYLVSTPIGALFTMGSGLSKNIWTLCILRFFAGLAFSPALAIGAGTVADVARAEGRATLHPYSLPWAGVRVTNLLPVSSHKQTNGLCRSSAPSSPSENPGAGPNGP